MGNDHQIQNQKNATLHPRLGLIAITSTTDQYGELSEEMSLQRTVET